MPTLAQLRSAVLLEADLRAGQVDDDDVTTLLNEELGELHELLADAHSDLLKTSGSVTIASGASSASLPAAFWRAVALQDSSGTRDLPELEWRDRHAPNDKGYTIEASTLHVFPAAEAPGTYTLYYIPTFTDLAADGDTVSYPNRWHMYAVLGAAIRLRTMQELSASGLEERRQAVRERIQNAAGQRKAKRKVRDARGVSTWQQWRRDWRENP